MPTLSLRHLTRSPSRETQEAGSSACLEHSERAGARDINPGHQHRDNIKSRGLDDSVGETVQRGLRRRLVLGAFRDVGIRQTGAGTKCEGEPLAQSRLRIGVWSVNATGRTSSSSSEQ